QDGLGMRCQIGSSRRNTEDEPAWDHRTPAVTASIAVATIDEEVAPHLAPFFEELAVTRAPARYAFLARRARHTSSGRVRCRTNQRSCSGENRANAPKCETHLTLLLMFETLNPATSTDTIRPPGHSDHH